MKLSVILSDAETTKVRRYSGDLEPFMLNTTHLIESPNRLPPSHLIGTDRQPNRQMCSMCTIMPLPLKYPI